MNDHERSLPVFIDFENLALGFQSQRNRFDTERVIERLVEKGKILFKKGYADWNRFSRYSQMLHEAARELIETPKRSQIEKNSADIRLCVDAMDLAYSKERINTFVVVSGDSDFSPKVSKLNELVKHVIGVGMQPSTSDPLRYNGDDLIYYENLDVQPGLGPVLSQSLPEGNVKVFAMFIESRLALRRENKSVPWSSMIKDTMKRQKPSFNQSYHGYRTFSELLEDARTAGLVEFEIDGKRRSYIVARFGAELHRPEESAKLSYLKGAQNRPNVRRLGGNCRVSASSIPYDKQSFLELPRRLNKAESIVPKASAEGEGIEVRQKVDDPNLDNDDITIRRGGISP